MKMYFSLATLHIIEMTMAIIGVVILLPGSKIFKGIVLGLDEGNHRSILIAETIWVIAVWIASGLILAASLMSLVIEGPHISSGMSIFGVIASPILIAWFTAFFVFEKRRYSREDAPLTPHT